MIDTLKIISMIDEKIYLKIHSMSNINTKYNNGTGELFYKIINDNLAGSYSSNISVRVGNGSKYKFTNMYYIEIEGSYHKFSKGYNSHNGFYNLTEISLKLIQFVETNYNIKLPKIKHWFLQRVDIAICYDLKNQENVQKYINNLSACNYPRRNLKYYENESIYISGSTTTLKIYNKYKEFKKNDYNKLKNTDFNLTEYMDEIKGFIRFECEIKKSKLKNYFDCDYVRVYKLDYNSLKEIWNIEFTKFLKYINNDLEKIFDKDKVRTRLLTLYNNIRAKNLFQFYILILTQGINEVRKDYCKSSYYKNTNDLKRANIDFSQKYTIDYKENNVDFNPFECDEIY